MVLLIEKPKTKDEISYITHCCSIFRDQKQILEGSGPYGGVAQLGEHLPCKQGVMGSNPIISTNLTKKVRCLTEV